MLTATPVSLGDYVPTADQVIVMSGVSWDGYETMLALRGDRSRPKLAYLDGELELMTTSRDHEGIKSSVGCLVERFCLETGIDFSPYGNWTLLQKVKDAGAEPDECYIFGKKPREKTQPDLVLEVVWTSGGINKLEIYRRLGIGEVWFWKRDAIRPFILVDGQYEERERSACIPDLDLAWLCKLAQIEPTSDAIRELVEQLKQPRED